MSGDTWSYPFFFSLFITLMSHQYMLLTWLIPQSPCALSFADPGLQLRPHRGSWWWIVNQRSYLWNVLADRIRSWLWIVVVDHDRGGKWWWTMMVDPDQSVDHEDGLWIMVASDCGGGSWSWWQLIVDYYFKQDCLIYNMPTHILYHYQLVQMHWF